MNILVVSQYFWPESFPINEIAKYLVSTGNKVDVLTGIPNYPKGKFYEGYSYRTKRHEEWNGLNIQRVSILPRGEGSKDIRLIPNYLSYVVKGRRAVRRIKKAEYDVVLVYLVSPITQAYPALLLKKKTNIPVVLYVGDLWPDTLFSHGLKSGLLKDVLTKACSGIYRKSDSIIAACESFIPRLLSYGCKKSALSYIPQWADEQYIPITSSGTLRNDLGISNDSFIVMFAGNLGFAQSIQTILDAALRLSDVERIKFVFVGDGTQREKSEEFCKSNKLTNCYFVGRKDPNEMPQIIAEADAMLVTLKDSYNYNMTVPTRVQAFLACGKPLIVAANGETARVVNQSCTGLVGEAEDDKALAENILMLSEFNDVEIRTLAESCVKFAVANYQKSRILKSLELELRKALRGSGGE